MKIKEIINNLTIHYNKHKTTRYIPVFIILILLFCIPTIWLWAKHGEFTTICDYKYRMYFLGKLRLEVFIGLLISLIGIFISFLILHSVGLKNNIENIDEFLEHLIRFFNNSEPDDEIQIVAPTLYFGKTSKKNRLADKFIYRFIRKTPKLNNTKIFIKNYDKSFCNNVNDDDFIHKLIPGHNDLIDFHLKLLKERSDNPNSHDFKIKYFKEFCKVYNEIYNNINIVVDIIPDDLSETNIILFLNNKKGIGLLGVFDEEDNYSLNANYIDNPKSVNVLKKLFENHS